MPRNALRQNEFVTLTEESTVDAPRAGGIPLVLHLAPWSFVVLAAFTLKRRLLEAEGGGYDFLAEVLGLGHGGKLNATLRLGLLRDDVRLAVLGSAVFLALLWVVRPRLRASAAWVVSTVLFLILYAQLKSWWEVGTFISIRLMLDALFGPGRDLIGDYATSRTVMKLLLAVLAMTLSCGALQWLHRNAERLAVRRRTRFVPWLVGAAGAGAMMVTQRGDVLETPFNRAAATGAVSAFLGYSEYTVPPPTLNARAPEQLIAQYAALANAPVPNAPSSLFGKARDYDVVFLLLESLPEACYNMTASEPFMPTLHALERSAIVPAAHYSTYPYSRRAYSSIFSSWYPLNGIRGAVERYGQLSRDLRAPGVAHSSALEGYETIAFVPERPVRLDEDELRYDALGFQHHEVPPAAFDKPEGFELNDSHRDWVRLRDRQAFDTLKQRVSAAIDGGKRFLYSFNPQVTHGPWPGLTATTTQEGTCAAGRPLFNEVDGMLAELVQLLRDKHRLDRTLIVAMGDHGLRTRREYPPFHAGTLDDITFHVPFVLYAPGVVDSATRIPWMTSHIDVAPSVLDLLGIDTDRALELGSPMWDPRVAARSTFFFAKGYLGADGYQREQQAVMVRYLYGGVSRAPWDGTLRFTTRDLLVAPDESTSRALEDLNLMAAIQGALARTMLPSATRLSRPRPGLDRVRVAAQRTPLAAAAPDRPQRR